LDKAVHRSRFLGPREGEKRDVHRHGVRQVAGRVYPLQPVILVSVFVEYHNCPYGTYRTCATCSTFRPVSRGRRGRSRVGCPLLSSLLSVCGGTKQEGRGKSGRGAGQDRAEQGRVEGSSGAVVIAIECIYCINTDMKTYYSLCVCV
jgi:hypothetical protein